MSNSSVIFSPQRVVQTIRSIRDWMRGKPLAADTEDAGPFGSDPFKDLRMAAEEAKAALDKDPKDATLRAKFVFAVAIYRDMSYTSATRIQLRRLSIQNRIRDDFELSRCAVDNQIE